MDDGYLPRILITDLEVNNYYEDLRACDKEKIIRIRLSTRIILFIMANYRRVISRSKAGFLRMAFSFQFFIIWPYIILMQINIREICIDQDQYLLYIDNNY